MLNHKEMLSAFPQSSPLFDAAVDQTLRQIHNTAVLERQATERRRIKRVLSWGLACAMLLACALGVAEGIRMGVFDFLLNREEALPQATELVQRDLAETRIGHTTLRVTEAVYDGAAVRFVMSVQNDTVKHPLTQREAYGEDGAFTKALQADGVTALYSFDWFTIDGTEYGITGGSGGENTVGANNGEALIYFELLLTENEGLTAPTHDFILGVPVRTGSTHEARQLFIPVKVTAANLLRSIVPAAPTTFGEGSAAYTVTVTDARLSPIRNVIELRVDVPDTVDEAAAWDCISPWYALALVDGSGAEIGRATTSFYGLPADESDDARHFMIRIEVTPMESYPGALFAAPMAYGKNGGWQADMSRAVKLNTEEK